jgi:hypothetical protein
MLGSKYANTQAYVWDEDKTTVQGPTTTVTIGNQNGYMIAYAYAFSGHGTAGGTSIDSITDKTNPLYEATGSFNIAEYTGQTITNSTTEYDAATKGTGASVYVFAYLTDSKGNIVPSSIASSIPISFTGTISNSVAPDDKVYATSPPTSGPLSSIGKAFISQFQQTNPNITASTYGTILQITPCGYSGGNYQGISPFDFGGATSLTLNGQASATNAFAPEFSAQIDTMQIALDEPTIPAPTAWSSSGTNLGTVGWDFTSLPAGTAYLTFTVSGDTKAGYANGSYSTGDFAPALSALGSTVTVSISGNTVTVTL